MAIHRKSIRLVLSSPFLFIFSVVYAQKPFLSDLSATKDTPLYTTYAAAMERSEFILDEGFHFLFYDPERGVDFITDTAGDWCMAFEKGGKTVYLLKDLAREPVIHMSYPDMVSYSYYPYDEVRVDVTFLVYSSRISIQDITFTNQGPESIQLKVHPFFYNTTRSFDGIQFFPDQNSISCTHEELPDGWVLGHNIPYVDKVHDVFLFSESPDRMASYRSYGGESVPIPQKVDLDREQVYLVRGRLHHGNGERCHHRNPKPRLMVLLNNDSSRLITENAPRWGSSDENINRYGFYGIELGNFRELKNGDSFALTLMCSETGEYAVIEGRVEDLPESTGKRVDVTFGCMEVIPPPEVFRKDDWGEGEAFGMYWDKIGSDMRYNVYRRDYRRDGVYELIAEKIPESFYTDKNISRDRITGYVVAAVDRLGNMGMVSEEVTNIVCSGFLADMRCSDKNQGDVKDLARVIAAEKKITLKAEESHHLRMIRGFAKDIVDLEIVSQQARNLLDEDLGTYVRVNERLFSRIPRLAFDDPEKELLYWNAFSLMRQVMLLPEGKCSYNYYVFSREPTWGWGHGGQVFHESLTMLAYAHMDPLSAMNSQRVYLERQHENGYINYRTGSYLDEVIKTDGELTSSAPWYAWQNWEIYRITRDKTFLEEMYSSSKKFYDYYVSNRDKDSDGLCEWGGHAVLESVRDAYVAVWDEVAWPSCFEGVDVNAMLVKEARCLAAMAGELGYTEEAEEWKRRAETRTEKVNEILWEDERGFYFHVDKRDNDFTYAKENDLKREEIIGFLPLWAGIASPEQAGRLVEKLTAPDKFWRKYGIPTLAADDAYYNPRGYWNGPVWVEWNALIVDGLIQYGYTEEAKELVDRVAENMIVQLKKSHNFWEFYSPDDPWAGYHKTYIWAGIIARMLMDVDKF